jgi:hypothetical protein
VALFEFRDLSGNLLVEFTRGPSYPLGRGIQQNVVVGESLGGFIRAQVRGQVRKRFELQFKLQPLDTYLAIMGFLDDYAGQRAPFYLIGDWTYFDGSWAFNGTDYPWWGGRRRVRLLEPAHNVPLVTVNLVEWGCTLLEDLV